MIRHKTNGDKTRCGISVKKIPLEQGLSLYWESVTCLHCWNKNINMLVTINGDDNGEFIHKINDARKSYNKHALCGVSVIDRCEKLWDKVTCPSCLLIKQAMLSYEAQKVSKRKYAKELRNKEKEARKQAIKQEITKATKIVIKVKEEIPEKVKHTVDMNKLRAYFGVKNG